ncbi:hypothetical protein niasHT_022100 [Heterodera trifolii]|uniref:Uncharacterized protein n=1 Tax=Heterodera trifolii TaxID=157864 RepID=A0ABD2KAK5_9BILA
MVSIVWEMKKICGVPCPSPNNCWEPLEFTQPNLCLAPSINPNNFENHLSMHEASVVMLCLFLFIGGFALGALFGFLPLCCDFFWARRKRRRFVPAANRPQTIRRSVRTSHEPLFVPPIYGISAV